MRQENKSLGLPTDPGSDSKHTELYAAATTESVIKNLQTELLNYGN
jgi:hypothetical protein